MVAVDRSARAFKMQEAPLDLTDHAARGCNEGLSVLPTALQVPPTWAGIDPLRETPHRRRVLPGAMLRLIDRDGFRELLLSEVTDFHGKGSRSMTEFQTATLVIQEATLAIQEATLSAQHVANTQAFWFGFAHAGVALAGVIVNAVLILKGLARMREAAAERSAELQDAQEDRRQQHTEAMQHAEAMTALHAMIHGMEAVIERTTPKKEDCRDE